MLDDAPLPLDASIRDFSKGRASNVANAMEKALLLPREMTELRNRKKHEVFLSLKRDLALVSLFNLALPLLFYFVNFLLNNCR